MQALSPDVREDIEYEFKSLKDMLDGNVSKMTALSIDYPKMYMAKVRDNVDRMHYHQMNAKEKYEYLRLENMYGYEDLKELFEEIDGLLAQAGKSIVENTVKPVDQSVRSFTLNYDRSGYRGRNIISRDRAWLEFVPKGSGPMTEDDMFRAVTLLEPGDPEIQKALDRGQPPMDIAPLENYDVYSVYATTTG